MKYLEVPLIYPLQKSFNSKDVSQILEKMPKHPIDIAPWLEFNYIPETYFSIGHDNKSLFIKFFVIEPVVKALFYRHNEPVYKDSCVEFFIAFDDEKEYYNFEFNAIGTCKLNFGTNRHNRKIISEQVIKKIQFLSTIQNQQTEEGITNIHWDLTLAIPSEAFSEHNIDSFSGKNCSVNFYKCGDDLPIPHFIAWNKIISGNPEFHLPEYFGEMKFL